MKVVLVRPNYISHIITPPLGLGYLSSWLRKHGIDTVLIDALRDGLSQDALIRRILREKPDAVGITCLTAWYHETVALSRALVDERCRVIIGGVHPTFLPVKTLLESQADFVICGEAEHALLELLSSGFDHRGIAGVYARHDPPLPGRDVVMARPVACLDDLPFPDWEQIRPASYPRAPHGAVVKNFPVGVVTSSRGCPFECTFCASPGFSDRKIRFRSPENVVDEIEHLVRNYGVREIHFEDDNLTLSRAHVTGICEQILARGLKISWACPNGIRADCVDEPMFSLMRKSGCYYVAFGIESANPGILKNIRKGESIATIRNAISIAEQVGIESQGFFIFGLPGETPATIEETIEFALESRLSRAQFLILDVLPGSELFGTLDGQFTPDWTKQSYKEPEWIPAGVTREMLQKAQSRAFRRFYLRSGILLRMIRHFHISQLLFIVKRLSDYRVMGG